MKLSGKLIYIISHEDWGKMLMSKHHYAIALAKRGNQVFFINHPDKRKVLKRGEIKVVPTGEKDVSVVMHRLIHPFFLKFKLRKLYNFLVSLHIRMIERKIARKPDVVWSFDTSNTLPLKYFSKRAIKILMPVDGPFGHDDELCSAEGADVIVSVTDSILNVFNGIAKPKLRVNHGVNDVFLNAHGKELNGQTVRIGYSGSLIREDIDRKSLLAIIKKYPDKIFEMWGEYDIHNSNIHLPQNISEGAKKFVEDLTQLPNVVLHGPVNSEQLASGLAGMNVLLICYNKDCQNSHKLLEYLATGKVVVSTYLSSYKNHRGLFEMVQNEDSVEFKKVFEKVIDDLDYYNSDHMIEVRKSYAANYSYSKNISMIEHFIQESLTAEKH